MQLTRIMLIWNISFEGRRNSFHIFCYLNLSSSYSLVFLCKSICCLVKTCQIKQMPWTGCVTCPHPQKIMKKTTKGERKYIPQEMKYGFTWNKNYFQNYWLLEKEKNISVNISSGQRLIAINRIQNKSCVHNIYLCVLCIYKYIQMHVYI